MKRIAILIVEDDKEVAHHLQLYLSQKCSTVDLAFDGKEAFDRYLNYHYDCIISDIEMPLLDGITLFEKIRSLDPYILLILFSGHTQEKYLLEMVTLKLDGYVMKPITSTKIDQMYEEIITQTKNNHMVICPQHTIVYSYLSKMITSKECCVSLSHFEIIVVELFLNNKYFIASYESLLEALYGNGNVSKDRLKNIIKRLRRKVPFVSIKPLVNVGYQLTCSEHYHG